MMPRMFCGRPDAFENEFRVRYTPPMNFHKDSDDEFLDDHNLQYILPQAIT